MFGNFWKLSEGWFKVVTMVTDQIIILKRENNCNTFLLLSFLHIVECYRVAGYSEEFLFCIRVGQVILLFFFFFGNPEIAESWFFSYKTWNFGPFKLQFNQAIQPWKSSGSAFNYPVHPATIQPSTIQFILQWSSLQRSGLQWSRLCRSGLQRSSLRRSGLQRSSLHRTGLQREICIELGILSSVGNGAPMGQPFTAPVATVALLIVCARGNEVHVFTCLRGRFGVESLFGTSNRLSRRSGTLCGLRNLMARNLRGGIIYLPV